MSRGGKREGAGPKRLVPNGKRIVILLNEETLKKIPKPWAKWIRELINRAVG